MNDVDFEKVRSLFENDDKEGLLVFSGEYFKKINSAQFVSTCDLLAREDARKLSWPKLSS